MSTYRRLRLEESTIHTDTAPPGDFEEYSRPTVNTTANVDKAKEILASISNETLNSQEHSSKVLIKKRKP